MCKESEFRRLRHLSLRRALHRLCAGAMKTGDGGSGASRDCSSLRWKRVPPAPAAQFREVMQVDAMLYLVEPSGLAMALCCSGSRDEMRLSG